MSLIIPYKEKELYSNQGAFIKPDGEIIYTYGLHETFSKRYCEGELYRVLRRYDDSDSILAGTSDDYENLSDYYEYLKEYYNFKGTIQKINEFSSSKLTSEELKLYKLWLEQYSFSMDDNVSDFMVYLLSFDKVETAMRETITTTNPNPHIRFFNYYLMDWFIIDQPPMKYNSNTGLFEYDKKNRYLGNSEDKEAEEEIKKIKAKVLIKDRPLFFK